MRAAYTLFLTATLAFVAPKTALADNKLKGLCAAALGGGYSAEPFDFELKIAAKDLNALPKNELGPFLKQIFDSLTAKILGPNGELTSTRPVMVPDFFVKASLETSASSAADYKLKSRYYLPGQWLHRGVLLQGQSISTEELLAGFVTRSPRVDTSRGVLKNTRSTEFNAVANVPGLVTRDFELYNRSLTNPEMFFSQTDSHSDDNPNGTSMHADPYVSTSTGYGNALHFARGIEIRKGVFKGGTRLVVTLPRPIYGAVPSDLVTLIGVKFGKNHSGMNAANADILDEKEILVAGGIDPDMKTRITAEDTQTGIIRIAERMPNAPDIFRVRTQSPKGKPGYSEVQEDYYELSKNGSGKPLFKKVRMEYSDAWKAIARVESTDPSLSTFFDAHSGVFEGYSVRLHTLLVLSRFFEQSQYYALSKKMKALKIDTLAVHDLNKFDVADLEKKRSARDKDSNKEHLRTLPILKSTFEKLGYSAGEIAIAEALFDNNVLGEVIQKKITVEAARALLEKQAARANMKLADFFRLQTLFFISDAGSYPNLESKLFSDMTGELTPMSPFFAKLKDLGG
jgi:hypothetical protein